MPPPCLSFNENWRKGVPVEFVLFILCSTRGQLALFCQSPFESYGIPVQRKWIWEIIALYSLILMPLFCTGKHFTIMETKNHVLHVILFFFLYTFLMFKYTICIICFKVGMICVSQVKLSFINGLVPSVAYVSLLPWLVFNIFLLMRDWIWRHHMYMETEPNKVGIYC